MAKLKNIHPGEILQERIPGPHVAGLFMANLAPYHSLSLLRTKISKLSE